MTYYQYTRQLTCNLTTTLNISLELDSGPQFAQSTELLFTVIAGEADYPATQLQAD